MLQPTDAEKIAAYTMRLPHAWQWLLAMAWLLVCLFPAGFATADGFSDGPDAKAMITLCGDLQSAGVAFAESLLTVHGGTVGCSGEDRMMMVSRDESCASFNAACVRPSPLFFGSKNWMDSNTHEHNNQPACCLMFPSSL